MSRPLRSGDLPAAAVLLLAGVVGVATAGGWFGVPVLNTRWIAATVLVGLVVLVVALLRRMATGAQSDRWVSVVLALPALGVVAAAVGGVAVGGVKQVEWFLNGDHPRHLVYVTDTWVQGTLAYGPETYPRAWHSLQAALWSVKGASLTPSDLDGLIRQASLATLLLSALLTLATAHVTHVLARACGVRDGLAVVAATVAASATLLNFAFANIQALGYQSTLAGAVVLAACTREMLLRPGSALAVLVCAAGVVVVSHTWQLLLVPALLAAVVCAVTWIREVGPRRAKPLAALVVGVVVLSGPALLAVVRDIGVSHARELGPDTPVPLALLVAGLLASAALARVHGERVVWSAVAVWLPAGTAAALALALDVPLDVYYPRKLLWHATVLGLPWVVTAGALVATRVTVGAPATRAGLRVVGGAAAGLTVLYGLLMPWGSLLGVWSTVDGDKVLAALAAPGAAHAQVVWLQADATTDAVTRSLLDTLRVADTRERAPQSRLSVEQECALLSAAEQPVVLTTASVTKVRERYDCSPGASVVRAPTTRE